jgi:predicted ATPase/DNA-binding XRE family transcriptional regulator
MNQVDEGVAGRSPFGELLRQYRLAAGLSQETLAERALISVDSVSALERGISRAPQRETFSRLVTALRLDPAQQRTIEKAMERRSQPRSASRRRAPTSNLPLALTNLYGRDQEVIELKNLLERLRLITLTGSGGVGKTRLALELGAQSVNRYADGVWFVDFATLRDAKLVSSLVAAVFSVGESFDHPLIEAIVDALRSKKMLLVLDNCEHVLLAAAALIEAIVQSARQVRVLATSREPLGVAGEQTYRVASLEPSAALALLEDRAKRVTEAFELTSDNIGTLQRICRRLDGIPLAIELAAARLSVLGPQQLDDRLSERFEVLTGGSPLALPRHQTMRALIDWSYNLLTADERLLFERLAVFPATFSLEAASAICRDETMGEWNVFDVLASLVAKSLVISELRGSTQRYRLLESVRAYALEAATNEGAVLQRRHAEYFVTRGELADKTFDSAPSTAEWAEELDPDLEDVRAALDWTLKERADIALGVRLLTALRDYWLLRGLGAEAARRAENAVESAALLPATLQAALWLTIAQTVGDVSSPAASYDAARRAQELYRLLDDGPHLVRALRVQGNASIRLGHFEDARRDLEQALALARTYGRQKDSARALANIGMLLKAGGKLQEARETFLEVLEMAQDNGDEVLKATTSLNLADLEFELGDAQSAATHAYESLETDFLRTNLRLRSHQEGNLAVYLLALHRQEDARAVALEAIRDARSSGHSGVTANSLQTVAATLPSEDGKRAARLLGYVEGILETTGYQRERTERYTYDVIVTALRAALTESEISTLMKMGRSLTEDQAVRIAQRRSSLTV